MGLYPSLRWYAGLFNESYEVDACASIIWSMDKGHTTKDQTGGLGLAILQEFITLNKGALQIVSANGMLDYRNGTTSTSVLQSDFPVRL